MNRFIQFMKKIEWVNASFLIFSPLIAISGIVFLAIHDAIQMPTVIFSALFSIATGMAITTGYHRLFSHRSYEANVIVKLVFLLLGAACFENSARLWASDHRNHHKYVDTELDPYSIKKGFWHAHIGWIMVKRVRIACDNITDLDKDALVQFQYKHYLLISILVGFVLPMGIAALWGDPIGGLILGGFTRVVFNHHSTFAINSFCHYFGTQPYSDRNSSRDSWATALITYGEGYHNYHHTFPSDYRNGVRFYHWDPTKWLIWLLNRFGQAHDLRRISDATILHVRLQRLERLILQKVERPAVQPDNVAERVTATRLAFETAFQHFQSLKTQFRMMNRKGRRIKFELREARDKARTALNEWVQVCAWFGVHPRLRL